jgi:hypothetical protein
VLAAVAVSRWIEHAAGWSIRKFAKTARRYRTIQSAAVMVWSPAWTPRASTHARRNDLETAVQLIAEALIGDAGLWFRPQSSKASGDTCRCGFSTTETVAHWWPTTHLGPVSAAR